MCIARNSSLMIQKLIDDLLDLGKIQKGVFNVNYGTFNLLDVILEAFHIISMHADQRKIKLLLQLD